MQADIASHGEEEENYGTLHVLAAMYASGLSFDFPTGPDSVGYAM